MLNGDWSIYNDGCRIEREIEIGLISCYSECCGSKLIWPISLTTQRIANADITMPVYEYEHIKQSCRLGATFEVQQSIHDAPLTHCPECGQQIKKLISHSNISTPRSNAELKDMGFTKLVKRDSGVYENVTARDGDSRYVVRDRPETLPNLSKTIRD